VSLMIPEVRDCVDCGSSSFVHYQINVHLHCHTILRTAVGQYHNTRSVWLDVAERQYIDDRRIS